MHEAVSLILAWIAGGALGLLFFGGLWWTLRRGLASQHPAAWILGSLLVRLGVTLTGFYFVADGRWLQLCVCLFGFLVGRAVTVRLTRLPVSEPRSAASEASHAPHAG